MPAVRGQGPRDGRERRQEQGHGSVGPRREHLDRGVAAVGRGSRPVGELPHDPVDPVDGDAVLRRRSERVESAARDDGRIAPRRHRPVVGPRGDRGVVADVAGQAADEHTGARRLRREPATSGRARRRTARRRRRSAPPS